MSSRRARSQDKHLKEVVFRKTLSIFSDLLDRDLDLDLGNQPQPSTNGQTIYLPTRVQEAGIRHLCYPLYVSFEHELAHLVFNTNFFDFITYRNDKEHKELATWCYNLVEDERIESCWNMIYRTPFRQIYKRLFILPNVRKGKQLTTMDVMMDVRGDFIRRTDTDYLVAWKEIKTILDSVRHLVSTVSTKRVADDLYNYLLNKGMLIGGTCDLVEGKRNRKKLNRQGHGMIKKIRINPNTKSSSNTMLSEEQYKMMRELISRYGNYFKHDNIYPDVNKIPKLPENATISDEKEVSAKFMDNIKRQLLPDYIPEDPEKRIIGEIEFKRFDRGEPAPVDKSIKSLIPFKRKATRWYSEVGEFDPDEYIQKRARKDRHDVDFFEDTINIKGMDIVFLVDYSGSMSGWYHRDENVKAGKEFLLKQAIYSLWKSVEMIPGINVQTIIFSGGWGSSTPMEIIKDPEEILKVRPSGATHTYRALDYVHRLLERRRDRRRVVFLLTDGEPTPDAIIKNPYAYVRSVVDRMKKSRIDLFTIFIDDRKLEEEKMRYFGNKQQCLYMPPEEMGKFLKTEIAKLVRTYTKSF